MSKPIKRVLAIFLAITLAFGASVPILAADQTSTVTELTLTQTANNSVGN